MTDSDSRPLHLDHLRSQAKDLRREFRDGHVPTKDLVRAFLRPERYSQVLQSGLALRDGQFVVAKRYGFDSWAALRRALDRRESLRALGEGDRFALLATLSYDPSDDPARWEEAKALLRDHPDITRHVPAAAAAAGDVEAVRTLVDSDSTLLHRRLGPRGWPLLLYACYSRVDIGGTSTEGVIEFLLDRGADPGSFYDWDDTYRFTALTGIIGGGECGLRRQPPHPGAERLIERLLRAGASPNESQGLYNRMVCGDMSILETLLRHGLTKEDLVHWQPSETAISTVGYMLRWAVQQGKTDTVDLLLSHGAKANEAPDGADDALRLAMQLGHGEIAKRLRDAGWREPELSLIERLTVAAIESDDQSLRRLLDEHPTLLQEARESLQAQFIRAAGQGRLPVLASLVKLGVDVNAGSPAALHQAAWHFQDDTIDWLLKNGADPARRDRGHDATPLDWLRYHLAQDEGDETDPRIRRCLQLLSRAGRGLPRDRSG